MVYLKRGEKDMNIQAAVFACRFTGVIGFLASIYLFQLYGWTGLIAGLIGSSLWFLLAIYLKRSSKS
jgi:hypothetical protein